ncbi:restriction endonuclease subunit S [Micromonospora globbae]|uniref:restriction endonuclease subunit S n=1 Tax=Micromonospora globbae TaxID=1894969 RepID=UPI003422724D
MFSDDDAWQVLPLADVLTFREGPGILARDFRSEGVPLLRLAGLKRGASLLDGCNYLDPEMVERRWSHFRLSAGDVLLSTSASLGEVAVVDETAQGAVPYTGIVAFRPRSSRIHLRFVQLALTAPSFKRQIEAMGVGSVMRHFGPSHLRQMKIALPPLERQLAIADVIEALDDKIAVNERISRTSLELSDAFFEAVVAGTPLSAATFGEVGQVFGGGTPRTSEPLYWNGGICWATPSDVTALNAPYLFATARRITDAGLANCASQLYPAGSILMTSRATIGAFAISQVPIAVNQGFIVVVPPSEEMRWWLFHEMRSRVDEMIGLANGSTFLELSRKNFKGMQVRVPDSELLARFASTVSPLHLRAANSQMENATLAALRDTLLPGLMSGEIQVRDAEKAVEDAI